MIRQNLVLFLFIYHEFLTLRPETHKAGNLRNLDRFSFFSMHRQSEVPPLVVCSCASSKQPTPQAKVVCNQSSPPSSTDTRKAFTCLCVCQCCIQTFLRVAFNISFYALSHILPLCTWIHTRERGHHTDTLSLSHT